MTGCTVLVPKPTASQAFWALTWFTVLMRRRHGEKKIKEWKDHRLPSVPVKFNCYVECFPAAVFAFQMWISLSPNVCHDSTLLHESHIWPMPASESPAWLFWCVHIRTQSGMCVETWVVIKLHNLLLRAGPFPALSMSSYAGELKPGREGNIKSIPNH